MSKQRCHFRCRFSQRCEYYHFKKNTKPRVKTKIIFLSFKEQAALKIFILFPILRGICKRIFAEPQKFLKHRIYRITKTMFKPSHFVKCQLVFNFTMKKTS